MPYTYPTLRRSLGGAEALAREVPESGLVVVLGCAGREGGTQADPGGTNAEGGDQGTAIQHAMSRHRRFLSGGE